MVTQVSSQLSAHKVWVVAVLCAVLISCYLVKETSARYIDDDCQGVMGNRDIYEKVVRICDDCANIFRMTPDINSKCRKNCFYNLDYLWCVYASERHGELDQLNRWMSILRAGRK